MKNHYDSFDNSVCVCILESETIGCWGVKGSQTEPIYGWDFSIDVLACNNLIQYSADTSSGSNLTLDFKQIKSRLIYY